jgi:hypothetical protein
MGPIPMVSDCVADTCDAADAAPSEMSIGLIRRDGCLHLYCPLTEKDRHYSARASMPGMIVDLKSAANDVCRHTF